MTDDLDALLADLAERTVDLAELIAAVEPLTCEWCGVALDVKDTGRLPRFCSDAHRQRAHRARRRREDQS